VFYFTAEPQTCVGNATLLHEDDLCTRSFCAATGFLHAALLQNEDRKTDFYTTLILRWKNGVVSTRIFSVFILPQQKNAKNDYILIQSQYLSRAGKAPCDAFGPGISRVLRVVELYGFHCDGAPACHVSF
jgi:hypothetical protein